MWEEAVWWAFVTFSRSCNGFNVLNTSYTCTLGPYLILFYALRSETTVGKQQHTISLSAGARGCSWSRLSPGVVPPIWRSLSHSCWYRLFRVTLLFAGSVSTPLHRSLWETSARITRFFSSSLPFNTCCFFSIDHAASSVCVKLKALHRPWTLVPVLPCLILNIHWQLISCLKFSPSLPPLWIGSHLAVTFACDLCVGHECCTGSPQLCTVIFTARCDGNTCDLTRITTQVRRERRQKHMTRASECEKVFPDHNRIISQWFLNGFQRFALLWHSRGCIITSAG